MVTDESVRFVHSELFILRGVQAPDETITLVELSSQTHASVLSSLDDACQDAEKAPAVAQLLFTGLGGIEKMADRNERIARLVDERAKLREKKRQTSPYLLVRCSGTSRLISMRHMKDLENMVVAFDALDESAIRRGADQAVAATLIALASELPDLGIEKVLTATVGYLEDERPLYSFGVEAGSPRLTVNKTLSPDMITSVSRRANALASPSEDETPRAQRLLLSSLQETEDRLRAFLFAWTALEVLLSKVFSQHRERVSQLLSDGQPVAVQKYVEWIG